MKIKENQSVSTIPLSEIPMGGCFKYQHRYCIRTTVSHVDSSNNLRITFVDLSTGYTSDICSDANVYSVDAVLQINKVGVIDDTSN